MAAQTRNDLTIYDTVAADWWSGDVRWVRTLKNMVPARLKHFDRYVEWAGLDVLDLGCAGGFMAEAISDLGARVEGIDPAADAIAAARTHADETGRHIGYQVGVGESLPYSNGAFDAVVCVDVLEHVADLDRVLAEVARVLRPGGWFLFDTINRTALARLAVVTMGENVFRLLPKGTHDPALFIRPADLRARLSDAGFNVERFAGLGPIGINKRGDPVFGRLPFTGVIYMGAARLCQVKTDEP
ncbi:MAG: bifunctional 2-polyprenyl-6-hydroxyphenol methylase/3-demethylubiquinol 3-O-methyltransferase UbiG [Pseudomonadota bacterium]